MKALKQPSNQARSLSHIKPLELVYAPKPERKRIEDLPVQGHRSLLPVVGMKATDRVFAIQMNDDSLSGDGVNAGDYVFVKLNFAQDEVTPGRLCAVITPSGSLIVRHVYHPLDNHVRLVASNSEYEEKVYEADSITIEGVAVAHQHNL